MNEIFDLQAWRQAMVDSITELGRSLAGFLPTLLTTIAVVVAGWIVSRVSEAIARRVLERVGLDRAAGRWRAAEALRRAGIAAPSRVLSRLVFWALMLMFLLSALETLGFTAVTSTIDRLVAFLPNVLGAGLLALLGVMLGRFVRNLVRSGAAAADVANAQRLGSAAGALVVLFVGVLALELLGIETDLLVTLLTVAVSVAGLTMGVAFALGSRPVITHVLAGHFLRQSLPPGSTLEVGGRKGAVQRVGAVETLLRNGDGAWSIPNGTLLDETIGR